MKKWLLLTAVAGVLPFTLCAQDDMYFTPSKKDKSQVVTVEQEKPTYYSGINQDVDEYNRRHLHSSYQVMGTDSLGNDIIEFTEGNGYPKDSLTVFQDDDDDFTYSRRMGRFDGFYGWYDPYFYSYWGGPWRSYWGYYDPWYWGYYDPWYYGGWGYYGYYGWGWPYRYRYYDYAWGYPYHYYSGSGRDGRYRPVTGTRNHGSVARGGFNGGSRSTFGNGGRGTAGVNRRGGTNSGTYTRTPQGSFSGGSRSYSGGSRSSGSTSRSSSYGSNRSSGSSFGGSSRSSGGTFGGGSRGGGGSFGGGSRGGGGGFGGGSRGGHR